LAKTHSVIALPETTYPDPFRANEAKFLRWIAAEASRREQLLRDFAVAIGEKSIAERNDIAITEAALTFYPGLTLTAVSVPGVGQDQFFFANQEGLLPSGALDGTNEPIYATNEQIGIILTPDAQRGCTLHLVDCGGALLARWTELDLFGTLPRIIRAGFDEALLGGIVKLRELALNPPPGAGLLRTGVLADLLARTELAGRLGGGGPQGRLVEDARRILADPEGDRLNLEAAAATLAMKSSWRMMDMGKLLVNSLGQRKRSVFVR